MSSNINLIEVTNLSYEELITIIDNDPVSHLAEVPFGNFQLELDLVHEVYQYSEDIGYGKTYMVSVNGNYAGYATLMATEMIHHRGTLRGVVDAFYIKPEYRSTGAFKTLLAYIEDDLQSNGIRFLTVGLNPNMPHIDKMQQFIHAKGYICTESSYTKELT
jgi:GNAT superfamily N-acetyltransferase